MAAETVDAALQEALIKRRREIGQQTGNSRLAIARIFLILHKRGEVAEWLIAPHSKCGIRATVSGVQIPPSPPYGIDI
jgi:hypothetical protein